MMTGLRLDTSCAATGMLVDGTEVNAPSRYESRIGIEPMSTDLQKLAHHLAN